MRHWWVRLRKRSASFPRVRRLILRHMQPNSALCKRSSHTIPIGANAISRPRMRSGHPCPILRVEGTVGIGLISCDRAKQGLDAGVALGLIQWMTEPQKYGMRHSMMCENSTQLSEPFAMCAGAHTATPFCSATDEMRGEVAGPRGANFENSTFDKPSL